MIMYYHSIVIKYFSKEKHIMKKILALILALAMALCLGACGKEKPDTEYIKDNGKMVIGITLFAPMNYYDANNNLIGFETEFAEAVCEELGVEAEFVEINWDAKETELASKKIDCIWNGMTITPDRQEEMSISVPYMSNKQVLVVKSENAGITSVEGLNIAVEAGSAGETVVNEDPFFANATCTPVSSMSTALMELEAGRVDACVIDYVTSLGSIGEGTDYNDLVLVDVEFSLGNDEQYGIAFRKGSDLTAEVNAIIEKLMGNGTLEEIAKKYKLEDQLIK